METKTTTASLTVPSTAGAIIGATNMLLELLNCRNAKTESVKIGDPSTVVIHAENWPHEEWFEMEVKPNTTYEQLSKLVEEQVDLIYNWIKTH